MSNPEVDYTQVANPEEKAAANVEALLQVARLTGWAGDNPARWKKVHSSLLGAYPPTWVLVEARCLLVAWAAAWLALTRAKDELARWKDLRRPLTRREQAAEAAREADIAFWRRLIRHLAPQIPGAIAEDQQSAGLLVSLVSENRDGAT